MLRPALLAFALASAAVPLAAQTAPGPDTRHIAADAGHAETGQPPKRIRSVLLTGNETCPKPANPSDEIVVCARQGEPYRIPKELRDEHPVAAKNQSWVNRTAVADAVGRQAAGLPDTCSPVGTGGQSGCALLRAQQYTAEKKASAAERAEP